MRCTSRRIKSSFNRCGSPWSGCDFPTPEAAGCHGIHAHRDPVAGVAQLFAGRDQKIDIIKSASEPAHHAAHEPNWQRQAQLPI
jgi:hypothetical protein